MQKSINDKVQTLRIIRSLHWMLIVCVLCQHCKYIAAAKKQTINIQHNYSETCL